MSKAQVLLTQYGQSHQNPTNKLIHWFAVPIIYWTVFLMLWSIPMPAATPSYLAGWLNWAVLGLILCQLYYFWLSFKLGIGTLLLNLAIWGLTLGLSQNTSIPLWQIGLVVFTLAWIAQFIGHYIEGEKPAFLTDIFFLLVGPAWCINFLMGRFGVKV